MDPKWAEPMVDDAVKRCADLLSKGAKWVCECPPKSIVDWRVPLYLVKRIGRDRSGDLAQLADVCEARAVALAECFYGAGKYVRKGRDGPGAAAWASMARCPAEIRHLIASKAQLVLPPLQ
jgi:hypothetical protein